MGLFRADSIGNPLSWRVADRCLAIALLMLTANAVVLMTVLAGGWPFLPFAASEAPSLPYGIAVCELGWLAIGLRAWQLRQRERVGSEPLPAPVLAIATVGWYALTLAGFTEITGPFAAPGWMGMLGGAVIGYVMFPRWLALAGVALYLVLTVGIALIHAEHLWPALETLAPPTPLFAMDHAEIVRAATASLVLSTLTFAIIAWVVDRWRDREARYARLASTDALTGLTNRRRFVELAERELARARRYDAEVALVVIDLDHFKRVNDEHGHAAGDAVLSRAPRRCWPATCAISTWSRAMAARSSRCSCPRPARPARSGGRRARAPPARRRRRDDRRGPGADHREHGRRHDPGPRRDLARPPAAARRRRAVSREGARPRSGRGRAAGRYRAVKCAAKNPRLSSTRSRQNAKSWPPGPRKNVCAMPRAVSRSWR